MKICTGTLLLILHFISTSSQAPLFEYKGRNTQEIKKETLFFAKNIVDIMPSFSDEIILSYQDQVDLNNQLRSIDGYFIGNNTNYAHFIDFLSIEISAACNGKVMVAKSTSQILTAEQKRILNDVDDGTDITVNLRFKLKNYLNPYKNSDRDVLQGKYMVTVIPETEAEYPGGFKQLSVFINNNIFNTITEKSSIDKLYQAMIRFTINEEGRVVNAKILRSSSDPHLDKLLLDTINKMPKWKPAENLSGRKVKQEFTIPIGGTGC